MPTKTTARRAGGKGCAKEKTLLIFYSSSIYGSRGCRQMSFQLISFFSVIILRLPRHTAGSALWSRISYLLEFIPGVESAMTSLMACCWVVVGGMSYARVVIGKLRRCFLWHFKLIIYSMAQFDVSPGAYIPISLSLLKRIAIASRCRVYWDFLRSGATKRRSAETTEGW